MKTIKYNRMDVDKIINGLLKGQIIAFPTDTVFGLACIINKEAINRIYQVKGRDFNKPLPMMCSSLDMISKVAYIDNKSQKLINKFMPGAITIIFKKKDVLKDYVTMGKDTIAIRIPDDKWIVDLIDKLNEPLMVTSANISNMGSLCKWEEVYESLKDKIDGIVCEDCKEVSIASTIVDVSAEIKILRSGPISQEDIMEAIK